MFYIIGVVVVVLVIAGFFRTPLISRARKRLASASLARIERGGRSAFRSTGPMAGWWTILVATRRRVGKDNLSVLAAGVAFQAFFSLFPTLTAAVSLYGLAADPSMVERQIRAIQGVLPPEAVKLIAAWLQALVQGPTTPFGIGLIVSVLLALWSVWSATAMLMTAVNICYGEEEKRGFVSFNLCALALGAGLAVFGIAALALVAVLPAALALLPVSDAWSHMLGLVRWPISGRDRHPCARRHLPLRAGSGAAEMAMDQLGIGCGSSALDLGLDRLHVLCLEGRQLRQDLRLARRRHHSAALVLSDRLRHPRGGGTERGDRAPRSPSRLSGVRTGALARSVTSP